MSCGAVPASRGTKIEISRTIPRIITLQISQPRMCSLKAAVRPLARSQNGTEMPLNRIRR